MSTSRSQACLVAAPKDSCHKPIPFRRKYTFLQVLSYAVVPGQSPPHFDQASQKGKEHLSVRLVLCLSGVSTNANFLEYSSQEQAGFACSEGASAFFSLRAYIVQASMVK
ncbi:hypothetical protein AN957_17825 [Cytobacillus solani]|uniref:Uncharacterized protein n=1 Tax=Cytobacillus solani TaxID=1637975 RepID=A0A0Q3TAA5_9BACI|nr:hypothetical protein AMS60_12515 [Bacillus sp. FJAT-21945]KQL20253.1 hypothetical protein AN957_17825 [Cytobacillus solani]